MTGKPTLTPLDEIIGENARRIRKRLGVTQEEMAAAMDCEANMLSMLENGKRAWTTKYIYAASLHYKISPAEFLGGSISDEDKKLAEQMKELLALKALTEKKNKAKP